MPQRGVHGVAVQQVEVAGALHQQAMRLRDAQRPQRVAVITTGVLFLLAWLHNPASAGMRRVYGILIVLAALAGVGVAARHIYVINAPAGAVAECGASLEYMMDVLPLHEVLGKVLSGSGECAKVTWRFLGFSMPFWVLLNLLGVAALGLFANWRKG